MRTRCIVFLPLAILITGVLFFLASSLVASIGSSLAPAIEPFILTARAGTSTIELIRFETECEGLRRRIEELARDASSCDAHPGCLQSPILCPIEMGEDLEREYDRLRRAVESRCTGLPTYATRSGRSCAVGDDACEARLCGAQDGWDGWNEKLDSLEPPATFVF